MKSKTKRKLQIIAVTLGPDKKWVAPFVWRVCELHKRTTGDVFRNAFAAHFAGRPGEGYFGGRGAERKDKDRFWFTIPKSMAWMSEAIDAESTRRGVSPATVMFIAFCEVYWKQFPELDAKYSAWKEINS